MQSLIVSTDRAIRITNLRAIPRVEPLEETELAEVDSGADVWAVSRDESYCLPVAPPTHRSLGLLALIAEDTARLNTDPRLRGGRVVVSDARGEVLHEVEIPA